MEKFLSLHSKVVILPNDNIDTDQIIPARYLKTTSKTGLGENLFADWRYKADGTPVADFPLNQPGATKAQILLTGDNFGCGSSREHAPWALAAFGFRAVISTSFADIFRNNALKNGLLPVQVDPDTHKAMFAMIRSYPQAEFTINLENQIIIWSEGKEAHFPIDKFSKNCLLQGVDELGFILSMDQNISAYETAHD